MSKLAIYLNDHLAAETLALDLARRARSSNSNNAYGQALETLVSEFADDRDAVERLMAELDVPRDRLKVASAWAAEKVGRLKLNGSLFHYSPLSRLVELEGLYLAATAKLALWESMRTATSSGGASSVDLDDLVARAESQRSRLEELRERAVAEAF